MILAIHPARCECLAGPGSRAHMLLQIELRNDGCAYLACFIIAYRLRPDLPESFSGKPSSVGSEDACMVDRGGIFLLQGDKLVKMREEPYDSEDRLQRWLADYPDLLAGEQIDAESPRRWLLMAREAGVSSEEGGADRWSMDHVFLDQDGTPTIIEVKRSNDTRIRREVVGQMLEYAANAATCLDVDRLRSQFDASCAKESKDPEEVLSSFLGEETDQEAFWERVRENLRAGRIRLVFAADEIPSELGRIIEFLNEQMDPAEVIGVEIKQYADARGGLKTFVPRVVGLTEQRRLTKRKPHPPISWDEDKYLEDARNRNTPEVVEIIHSLLKFAKAEADRVRWGRGGVYGTFGFDIEKDGKMVPVFTVFSDSRMEIAFGSLDQNDVDKELIDGFRDSLGEFEGLSDLPENPKWPQRKVEQVFTKNEYLDRFKEIVRNLKAQIRRERRSSA